MKSFFYLIIILSISIFLQAQQNNDINITAGNDLKGGNVNIRGGTGSDLSGGGINLIAGDGFGGLGGEIHIESGYSEGYNGGNLTIKVGDGADGGDVFMSAGNGSYSEGGWFTINAGDGYDNGGYVIINAGNAGNAGNNDGGYIILTPGTGGTGNPNGLVKIIGSGTYSGTWTQSSDERFNKNVEIIQNPIDKLSKINGIRYELKTDEFPDKNFNTGKQIGLVAQEVEKVFPELVSTDSEGYKSLAYQNMVAVLIEAMKEQQKQIERLNDRIENLEK